MSQKPIQFLKGQSSDLSQEAIQEGNFLFTEDTNELYIDYENSTGTKNRKPIKDKETADRVTELEERVPTNTTEANKVWKTDTNGNPGWHEDENTTYNNFVKSGSGAKAGLVPAPSTTAGTTKYLREDGTWQVPTNTKNTAGASNTSSKIYLVGATSQGTNPQTYTHDTAYVGTDGCLYSNSQKTLTNGGATGTSAAALGYGNSASGTYSLAEGYYNNATGNYSHVEGMYNNQTLPTSGTSFVSTSTSSNNIAFVGGGSASKSFNGITYSYVLMTYANFCGATFNLPSVSNSTGNYLASATFRLNSNGSTFSANVYVSTNYCSGSIAVFHNNSTINSQYSIAQLSSITIIQAEVNVQIDLTASHIQGKYSNIDRTYAHVVGNGTSTSNRSNAHTLDWSGNAWYAGDVKAKYNGTEYSLGQLGVAVANINSQLTSVNSILEQI